jgi:hypothetical protein
MAITTVGEILRRAKLILQEITQNGTRWTNEELLGWLNESYQAIIAIKPDASSINKVMDCVIGTRQEIPADGHRLLDVVRNTAIGSNGYSVMKTSRGALDATRRAWHSETPSITVEQFVFDDNDPKHFYVYPPATATAKLEIIYSAVPQPHAIAEANGSSLEVIRLSDSFAPAIVDYILARAYSKDAESGANLQRAQMHSGSFVNMLGAEANAGLVFSPNRELPGGSV